MKESFYCVLFFSSYVLPIAIIAEQKLLEVAAGLENFSGEYHKEEMIMKKILDSFVLISYLGKTSQLHKEGTSLFLNQTEVAIIFKHTKLYLGLSEIMLICQKAFKL